VQKVMWREDASNFETRPGEIFVCKMLVSFKYTTPKMSAVVLQVTQLVLRKYFLAIRVICDLVASEISTFNISMAYINFPRIN
jgi:hypothetical protein